jgi:quercetin dioxygenase-like cupin family protein
VVLEPGGASQLHRTVSVDFVVVTNGHVQMQTDAGDVLDLFPGDVVVQRATMHRWSNPSEDEAARFVAVIVPAEEFEVPGLGKVAEEHVAGTEVKGWNVSQLEK